MKIKKFLQVLCIAYTICCYQFVFAQVESCVFETHSEGIEVINMGDRQIYTLFTEHISDMEQNEVLDALDNNRDRTSSSFIAGLNEVIEKYLEIIESEQSDVQKITRLAESEQISWIGVEYSPEELRDSGYSDFNGMVQFYSTIRSELNDQILWHPRKTDQILHLLTGPVVIAGFSRPEVFMEVQIVPLEDNNLKRESLRRLQERRQIQNSLVAFAQEGIITTRLLHLLNLFVQNTQYVSNREFENFLKTFVDTQFVNTQETTARTSQNGIPIPEEWSMLLRTPLTPAQAEVQMLMRSYIDNNNTLLFDLINLRDQAIVQSVLNQPGNGLIIFGTDHGPGIKEGLTTACQNGL